PTDLLLTYRNFGTVTLYGIDLGIMTYLSTRVMLKGTYSWTSNDFFANVGGFTDIALNAPRNKASLAGTYHAADAGVTFELAARYVAGFPVASGVFIGEVDSYGLLDANLSFRLPFGRDVTLAFSGRNLLGTMHRQFVGAPEIGRLILGRMKASI
ncbi:MAG: TonB-dependent receptor, partial [Gemmatimonadales bacterium]